MLKMLEEQVLAEIERLKLRHSELSGAANMDIGIYADAKKLTEKIRFFAESLLVPGVNGELKRSAILANIEEIKRVDDRTFSLEFTYNGTPKRLGWGGKWYFEVPFLASKKKARSPP